MEVLLKFGSFLEFLELGVADLGSGQLSGFSELVLDERVETRLIDVPLRERELPRFQA
jgi:hypothetical protein